MNEPRVNDLNASPLSAVAFDDDHPISSLKLSKPVDVRNTSLVVIAVIGALAALHWASPVVTPFMLGLTISYALNPVVNAFERWSIPRSVGAALVMLAIIAGSVWTVIHFRDDANALIDSLPTLVERVKQTLNKSQGSTESAIDKVQRAAAQLESAASGGSAQEDNKQVRRSTNPVARVRVERAPFNIKDYLWTGSIGLASSLGQLLAILFIAYFFLASGNSFRRKLVKITGPTLSKKKLTVQALDEITDQVQRYLLVQIAMSALVGLSTAVAFLGLGVNNAVSWGVAAFLLNFIPYIGSIVITGGAALVGFLQFGSINMAAVLAGICVSLHIVTGYLVGPLLTSRTSRLNALSVFVGVLAFGWLWGLAGLLLGVPILIMLKAICDRVEEFKPVGELLGR